MCVVWQARSYRTISIRFWTFLPVFDRREWKETGRAERWVWPVRIRATDAAPNLKMGAASKVFFFNSIL